VVAAHERRDQSSATRTAFPWCRSRSSVGGTVVVRTSTYTSLRAHTAAGIICMVLGRGTSEGSPSIVCPTV
jgi:hypothetical protein